MTLEEAKVELEKFVKLKTTMRPVFVQPLLDAKEVKHGHWIEVQRIHEKDHTAICECSLCGDTVWVYDGQRAWNYCPNCGAKMDEVEDEID